MTDRTIVLNGGVVGGDWFLLMYRKSKYNLEHFLTFNKNDYWIYKTTGKQREVSYEEFLEFKFCGYTFFKKELYNKDEINKWIEFLYSFVSIPFLNKPFPPIEIMSKIKIKK